MKNYKDYTSQLHIPINDSLFSTEIKDKPFIGFPIKNGYDYARHYNTIPAHYDPQYIKYNEEYYYGVWGEFKDGKNILTLDKKTSFLHCNNKVHTVEYTQGKLTLENKYHGLDTIVYMESTAPFYVRVAAMYIFQFLH